MNWLKKYSKIFSLTLVMTLILSGICFAEVISGGIRKEYNSTDKKKFEIPYKEPNYPKSAILAYNKGILYYNNSDYNEAIDSFKLAVKQEPMFADAYFNLGILYDYFDNPNDAIIYFNRAYIINKKDYEALYYMVKCYWLMNDKVAARFYLDKIPKDSEYYTKVQQLLN